MEDALTEYLPELDLSYEAPLNANEYGRGDTIVQPMQDLEREVGTDLVEDLA